VSSPAFTPASKEFRTDINGLRAWAVTAVLLYHFGIPGIGGGFVGVDVFFVISGFLMTGIILNGMESDRFTLGRFYLARARRIMPALLVLCLVELVAGWFLLMPDEYQRLGLHVRESLYFASNLQYLSEAGYFDIASREKWLLHTWSLSVEWQFYMLLPLLLLISWQWNLLRRQISWILITLIMLSLAWCMWSTPHSPDKAFYSLSTRAWELLAGGLIFLAARKSPLSHRWAQWTECVGFILIVSSIGLLNKHTPWPGALALLPVTGTMLVLWASRQSSLWTNTKVAQWLGTRSYSLYLWHWPLVVALAYMEKEQAPMWIATGLFLAVVLGHLSYHLVEVPSQRWLIAMTPRRASIVILVILISALLITQQVRRTGFPDRLPPHIAALEAERHNSAPHWAKCSKPDAACTFGEGKTLGAIIIGDSHAYTVITALADSLPSQEHILFKGVARCPIAFGIQTRKKDCVSLNESLSQANTLPNGIPVIMVGRTSEYIGHNTDLPVSAGAPSFHFGSPHDQFNQAYREDFRKHYIDTMCAIAQNHPLWLLRPLPEMPVAVPTAIGRALLLGMPPRRITETLTDYHSRTSLVWDMQDEVVKHCGAKILNPLPFLCDQQECSGSSPEGRPYFRDHDHLSEFGNRRLIPMFRSAFNHPQPIEK
jgi:peptidoglycan/LPS O-acetylase OafA/YrhL